MIYVHQCHQCKRSKPIEVWYQMKFVGDEQNLDKETLRLITCSKHGLMSRIPQVPMLGMQQGGSTVTEKDLLKDKQAKKKTRSRAHFKNTVLPTLSDKSSKKYFEAKYKGTKNIDHEKLK